MTYCAVSFSEAEAFCLSTLFILAYEMIFPMHLYFSVPHLCLAHYCLTNIWSYIHALQYFLVSLGKCVWVN